MKIITDEKILRKISEPVTPDDNIEEMIAQIKEALKTAWTDGCGLAAIQIGIPKRFAWCKIADQELILINPIILKEEGCLVEREGCLSIPHERTMVRRAKKIYFTTQQNGDKIFEATDFMAIVIQHEIDHMDGILNTDKEYKLTKVGRNTPCPCGSGKKYKQCCL